MLVEVFKQCPPFLVVVDNASKRVEKERALEVHVLRRRRVDAALADDGLLIPNFQFVAVRVFQIVIVPVHIFDVEAFQICRPAFVNPHVRAVTGCDGVSEPLVPALVNDDEIELETDADARPVALQIAVRKVVAVGDCALMLHA